MGISQPKIENVSVRLAQDESEVHASQRLRYQVFYQEHAAIPDEAMKAAERDMDKFDDIADHLIVIDESRSNGAKAIVGTYRLLRREVAEKHGRFYTADEYDISPLLNGEKSLLELGRSCVLPQYRTRPVMQLLWQGISEYMYQHDINLMFGCASMPGTDVEAAASRLAYMHHYHLAPEGLRPRALPERYVEMNRLSRDEFDAKRTFASLPPLIKGYLRLGASIGEGAVLDHQFDTTDVCIVFPVNQMSSRYRRYYTRRAGGKDLPGTEQEAVTAVNEHSLDHSLGEGTA